MVFEKYRVKHSINSFLILDTLPEFLYSLNLFHKEGPGLSLAMILCSLSMWFLKELLDNKCIYR